MSVEHPNRATDHLLGKMWKTKSARFNARVRLRAKHWLSITTTSFLSGYLVCASLIQLVFEEGIEKDVAKLLSVGNIIVSILLIIVTLLEAMKNHEQEGKQLHDCAQDISALYNEFQALSIDDAERQRTAFNTRYNAIMSAHNVSHKDIDQAWFKMLNAKELGLGFFGQLANFVYWVILMIVEYWLYLAMIVLPPLALWSILEVVVR